jgi:hypothetical protein
MSCQAFRPARRILVSGLFLVFSFFVIGCGSRVRVHGNVTFDGQPIDGGRIVFLPEGDPAGRPTAEATLDQGAYSLPVSKGPNLSTGKHRVEIVWHKPPPGKEKRKPGDPGFTTDDYVQVLPAAYNSKTTLSVDLQAGDNTFDFALKRHP